MRGSNICEVHPVPLLALVLLHLIADHLVSHSFERLAGYWIVGLGIAGCIAHSVYSPARSVEILAAEFVVRTADSNHSPHHLCSCPLALLVVVEARGAGQVVAGSVGILYSADTHPSSAIG